MKKLIIYSLFILFCAGILALSLRGIAGNPTSKDINELKWKDDGPFELSPDRGRFALTLSYIENNSFFFSQPIAKFATPDLGYKNGNFVSLFAPAVSFAIIPGYLVGKAFNLAQVGSFAIISLFALMNVSLIIAICRKLHVHPAAAILGAIAFLFASPAFAYSVTLYQHHISTFLILLALYSLIAWDSFWSFELIWFLFAASIPVDYPNLFIMLPIAFGALAKIVIIKSQEERLQMKIKLTGILATITIIFPLIFFMWFNQVSYGNPFQFSGTVEQVKGLDKDGKVIKDTKIDKNNADALLQKEPTQATPKKKSALTFFKPRNLLNGFYIHFLSPDRGIIMYTPVVLLGILGMIFLYKKKTQVFAILVGIVGFNVLLYSMWGDPWGGWAFGSRYLIPSYAIMSICIAVALSWLKKSKIFLSIFFIVLVYSISVNALGAITSSRNPPQVEVLSLEKLSHREEKYTYARNYDYVKNNYLKSFVWQTFAKGFLSAQEYYYILVALIVTSSIPAVYFLFMKGEKNEIQS